jgi:hypothetical protein
MEKSEARFIVVVLPRQTYPYPEYIRLSTIPPVPLPKIGNIPTPVLGTPSIPSEEELKLYNNIKD